MVKRNVLIQNLLDSQNERLYGMVQQQADAQGICICCKRHVDVNDKEYQISALCNPCFDSVTADD